MNRKTKAGTNIQSVKNQNQQAAQSKAGQFETEFAEETNVEQVKKQNKKSQQNKQ